MSTIDKLLSGASWFCDGWDPNLKLFHRLRSKLFETLSPYQRVEIYDTDAFGRMLVIDGLPQAAEQDEMIYAKAIAWPAILNLKREKRILITGGGDGHVLREALRFPSVVAVTVCDIDPSVTAATLEWMPFMWNNCDKDPRALLVRADALEYLASRPPASLEIVISDITDPTGEETASHH